MSGDRKVLRSTFDGVAELYDRVRPGYGEDLFDELFEIAGFGSPPSVLEVGCGTGQASVPLARRSLDLTCIEMGEGMSAVARRNLAEFPNARVITEPFESWNAGRLRFDMVFCAMAWHWIDPTIRYLKAAGLLRPRGILAIVTVVHVFPDGFDPFFTEIQTCYDAISDRWGTFQFWRPDDVPDLSAEIAASELFGDIEVKRTLSSLEYTAERYIDLLSTYSDHISMEPSKREFLFSEIRSTIGARPSGLIRKHFLTMLHVAQVL